MIDITAVKRDKKLSNDKFDRCYYCGHNHKRGKQNCLEFGKTCDGCGQRNHLKAMCRSKDQGLKHGSKKTSKKCTHRCYIHEMNECHDYMEDLQDQVQSLFYS